MNIGRIGNKVAWFKAEHVIFFLLVIVFCAPVAFISNYHTIDGPAHLYNAGILKEFIGGNSNFWSNYFTVNREPIPNWGGHVLLSSLMLIGVTTAWANKLLLLLYLISFAYSFRFSIAKLFPSGIWASYFVFLHLHNFQIYFGFYNFCLSIPVLLIAMYTTAMFFNTYKNKWLAYTCILSFALFFFHLLAVLFLLLFTGCLFLFSCIKTIQEKHNKSKTVILIGNTIVKLTLALIPLMLLVGTYFLNRPPLLNKKYLSHTELLLWLVKVRSSVVYDWAIADYLIISGIATLSVLIFAAIKTLIKQKPVINYLSYSLLTLTALTLVLLFVLPDEDGYGSLISVRIVFVFYIFASLFIASANIPKWLIQSATTLSIVVAFFSWIQTLTTQNELSHDITKLQECNRHLPANKTAIVVNLNKNWLKGHYPNYIGIGKNIFIPDNYEASVGYFPLLWQTNLPCVMAGKQTSEMLGTYWKSNDTSTDKQIADYFIIIKDDNPEQFQHKEQIEEDYTILLENERVIAYHRK